jgi:hypothetical protein
MDLNKLLWSSLLLNGLYQDLPGQDFDPCKFKTYTERQSNAVSLDSIKVATKTKTLSWQGEWSPAMNLHSSGVSKNGCKIQGGSQGKFQLNNTGERIVFLTVIESKLDGNIYPDSLRSLQNDMLRIQSSIESKPKSTKHPKASIQSDFRTAVFKNRSMKIPGSSTETPIAWLFPAEINCSVGLKSELKAGNYIECGLAGLKLQFIRKALVNEENTPYYSNLKAPNYFMVNGGLQISAQWNQTLGKWLEFEHSSRVFKTLFPENKKPDIELKNSLTIKHGKNFQTSIRQSYSISQTLGTLADIQSEVVMGYRFSASSSKN